MNYPSEYIDYLVHFHGDRDYFECHELLEDYWKKVDYGNKNSIWVGLIQFAVANYHYRRGNLTGALRTLQKSHHIFLLNKNQINKIGINVTLLMQQLENLLFRIKNNEKYYSTNLPIHSHKLIKLCEKRSHELHLTWCKSSDEQNLQVVHRHLNRDRSKILEQREKALYTRRKKKNL